MTVSVSAIGNHGSTLTAMVSGIGNSVTPTEIIDVRVDTPVMFTVTAGLDAGDETLTLTASHPDYDSTSTEVDVRVDLRPLELSVEPSPLEIVIGTSKILTIGVSATEGVTLTVTVDRDGIIKELADEYLLTSGETSMTIEVIGNAIGDTILTITAEAEGYTSATTTVSVEVLDSLRIEVDTDRLSLVEGGDDAELRVSLNRIDTARGEVEVMINPDPEASELTVSPSALTFSSSLGRQSITVQTTTDSTYTGDRRRTLILTAKGYATTMVTVDIIENTPQPIGLKVISSTELSLVRFASTEITVRVGVEAILDVETTGAVVLADGVASRYDLTEGALSQQIQIRGDSVGEGTVTFTVSGNRKITATEVVTVTVSTPTLMISASTDVLNIAANQTTAGLTVTVSAADEDDLTNITLTAIIDDGDVARVISTTITNVSVNTQTMFTVEGLATATDNTILTLTASHQKLQAGKYKNSCRCDPVNGCIKV